MGGDADIRKACAITFYTGPEGDARTTGAAEIVGADSDIRGIREITIPPPQTPPTKDVKSHFYAP